MAKDDVRIPGIDVWRDRFAGDGDRYVVIGGTARELVYAERGVWEDTATKDLDVVLIAEAIDAGFVSRFMSFVREGGYSHVTKSGDTQMYRFSQPVDAFFRSRWNSSAVGRTICKASRPSSARCP